MNQERIGKYIQEKRKLKELTQQELANIIGVTDRAISKWENGRDLPDLSLLKTLCDALDISLNSLLSGEDIKERELDLTTEKNFALVKSYLITKDSKNYYAYVWILEATFFKKDNLIDVDSSSSIPYKFTLKQRNNKYEIVNIEYPRDGIFNKTDLENIFPKSIINKFNTIHNDGTISRLEDINYEKALKYFNIE